MDMNRYQVLAARTINKELQYHEQVLHALHGMCAEVGEIHGMFQKIYQGHDLDGEHLKKEVGDVLWFVAEFCTALDLFMDDVAEMNIEKLKARFPEGFEAERSLHRKEGDV